MIEKIPISVLIPMYNDEKGIKIALESLKAQQFTNFEVIIIDDGSSDNSKEIARSIYPSSKIFSQRNQGIATALNYGLQFCIGKYIARLDCHDRANPLRFQKQIQFLEENQGVGAVGCHIVLFDQNENQIGKCKFPIGSFNLLNELKNGNSPISHTGAMIRKSDLDYIGGYDPFFNGREDFELWCRLSIICELDNINEFLMEVYTNSEGISYNSNYLEPLEKLALFERTQKLNFGISWFDKEIREKYFKGIEESLRLLNNKDHAKMQSLYYLKRAMFLLKSGDKKNSRVFFQKSLNRYFFSIKAIIGYLSSFFLPTDFYNQLLRIFKFFKNKL